VDRDEIIHALRAIDRQDAAALRERFGLEDEG
jgi:hypothetical protein